MARSLPLSDDYRDQDSIYQSAVYNSVFVIENTREAVNAAVAITGENEVKKVELIEEDIDLLRQGKLLVISIGSMGTPEYSVVLNLKQGVS